MNPSWIVLSLVSTLATPANVGAGIGAGGERDVLVRVNAQSDPAGDFDAQAWREKLALPNLADREREFENLVERARRDDRARKALEEWAANSAQPELAWTARLALREIQRAGPAPSRSGATAPAPFGSTAPGPGLDALRRRFDELERQFGGLDSLFEDMQREMQRFQGGPNAPRISPWWSGTPAPGTGTRSSESYSLNVTPHGVKVEIDEDVGGQRERKTYEAPSLDELYQAHPELREKLGARVQILNGDAFGPLAPGTLPDWGRRLFGDPTPEVDRNAPQAVRPLRGAPRTDVLGVVIRKPTDAETKDLKLEPDVGLVVEGVDPNSIASRIGVESGDVLLELNGRPLKGREDVRAVLESRAAHEDVQVTLVDRQGKRTTLTWRAPSPPSAPDARGEEARRF